jgi:hypothetical protein
LGAGVGAPVRCDKEAGKLAQNNAWSLVDIRAPGRANRAAGAACRVQRSDVRLDREFAGLAIRSRLFDLCRFLPHKARRCQSNRAA